MEKITFIGGGNMARALIGGLLQQGRMPDELTVVEVDADKRRQLQHDFGIDTSDQLAAAAGADIVVLAVKPQQLRDLAIFLGSLLRNQLIVSIAAGIRTGDLIRWLGNYSQVVRVMPNTPAQIQVGISALYAAPGASVAQRCQAAGLLAAVGTCVWFEDESLLDAATAISGSGPAYVFYFLEAMLQAGGELGLAPEQSRLLALHTFIGATRLALDSPLAPSALRAQVTSKGGTTERALLTMEEAGVKSAIVRAIHAASARSAELGRLLGKD
jgi:pyrroline-5-carboxylate reductase